MIRTSRISSLFLVVAFMLMTPVGIYTCGSLAGSISYMRGDDILPFPCEDLGALHLTETAVTSYLTVPYLATELLAAIVTTFFVSLTLVFYYSSQVTKRKPPTPPPCFAR